MFCIYDYMLNIICYSIISYMTMYLYVFFHTTELHNNNYGQLSWFQIANFKWGVSNPKSKHAAYLSVLSRISNCQGLGRKNKFEILKTDRKYIYIYIYIYMTIIYCALGQPRKRRALARPKRQHYTILCYGILCYTMIYCIMSYYSGPHSSVVRAWAQVAEALSSSPADGQRAELKSWVG